jgi:hypothetical protein
MIERPARDKAIMPIGAVPRSDGESMVLVCNEVWGGNRTFHGPIELPGLRGVLFSQPCEGGRGGDVHYLSVCGSGLVSRALLAGGLLVLLQNLMDEWQEGFELGLAAGPGPPIARRLGVGQDLRERVPVQAILPAGLAFAESFGQYASSDLGPELHVGVHPRGPRRRLAST